MPRLTLFAFVLFAGAGAVVAGCATDDAEPTADASPAVDAAPAVDARVIDAPVGTTCAVKEPILQIGYTCQFAWRQCTGTGDRMLLCQITSVAGHVFSLCRCMVGGQETMQFASETICGSTGWSQVEAIANDKCGWNLL